MPSKPYIVNTDVNSIIEKYWSNRDVKTTTPIFSHNMNLLQKELIEYYYPIMDNDSRKRADNSLKMLNMKINDYLNINSNSTTPENSVEVYELNKTVYESIDKETAAKIIEMLDSTTLNNIEPEHVKPIIISKPTRSRGLGGRSTKVLSDVP